MAVFGATYPEAMHTAVPSWARNGFYHLFASADPYNTRGTCGGTQTTAVTNLRQIRNFRDLASAAPDVLRPYSVFRCANPLQCNEESAALLQDTLGVRMVVRTRSVRQPLQHVPGGYATLVLLR